MIDLEYGFSFLSSFLLSVFVMGFDVQCLFLRFFICFLFIVLEISTKLLLYWFAFFFSCVLVHGGQRNSRSLGTINFGFVFFFVFILLCLLFSVFLCNHCEYLFLYFD